MKFQPCSVENTQFRMKPTGIRSIQFPFLFSLLLHILGFLVLFSFFKPSVQQYSEGALMVFLSEITPSVVKRPVKRPVRQPNIHKPQHSMPELSPRPSPGVQAGSSGVAASHLPLLQDHRSLSDGLLPTAGAGVTEGEGLGLRGMPGSGAGTGGAGMVPGSQRIVAYQPTTQATTRDRSHRVARPFADDLPTMSIVPEELLELPGNDDSNLDVEPLDIADVDRIDVVFVISCGYTMYKYIPQAVQFAEREIQRYIASQKDYRVGIIKSQFLWPPHEIERWPLSSHLDKALAVIREIPAFISEAQKHNFVARDIQLNAIQYALERCAFRPGADHRIIVMGNDIPMCGGYSPLSLIERCQQKQVVLDIHGADQQVGRLLAHKTGGKWYPVFENPGDAEALEQIHIGSKYWKLRYTLDDVVERRLSTPDW